MLSELRLGDNVTFYKNGVENSSKFIYVGYEILTDETGNRGVRYIFKQVRKI